LHCTTETTTHRAGTPRILIQVENRHALQTKLRDVYVNAIWENFH
jgi:hypothetical protein